MPMGCASLPSVRTSESCPSSVSSDQFWTYTMRSSTGDQDTSETFRVFVTCSASAALADEIQMSYLPSSLAECRKAICCPSGERLGAELKPGGGGAFHGFAPPTPETKIAEPPFVSHASFSPSGETLSSSKMSRKHIILLSVPSAYMCWT